MIQKHEQQSQPTQKAILGRRMLLGAAVGLVWIGALLLAAGEANPAWPKYWMLRPLLLVPFAGAVGALCHYLLIRHHNRIGLGKTAAAILSLLVFLMSLWLGTVLGLDGTLWD